MKKKLLLSSFLVAGLVGSGTALAVTPANTTVDGNATYYATGAIVPSSVKFDGYNARDRKIYLDITMQASTGNLPTTVPYTIDVIDNSLDTTIMGGTPATKTMSVVGTVTTADDTEVTVTLPSGTALPEDYRILVVADID